MLHRWSGACATALFLLIAVGGPIEASAQDVADMSLEDAKKYLNQSLNETGALRKTIGRALYKSTEEVKSIKSLLTTSSKGISAMNDLMMEMMELNKRMQQFGGSMDACRREIKEIQSQETESISPDEVNDPVLGATTSLLQLHEHTRTLRLQILALKASAQSIPTAGTGPKSTALRSPRKGGDAELLLGRTQGLV